MKAKTLLFALSLASAACTKEEHVTQPPTAEEQTDVAESITAAVQQDPSLQRFIKDSYGYVVFPSVGKGGLIVGASHGTGWVYEQGRLTGTAKLSRVSVGAQVGGESFTEILFMKDANAMAAFKTGSFKLGARAAAVAVTAGAAAHAGYDATGVAVFTMHKGGALVEASVGGQGFAYEPLDLRGQRVAEPGHAVPAGGQPVAREVKPVEQPAPAPPPAPAAPPPTGVSIDQEIIAKCHLDHGKTFFEFDNSNLSACDLTTINDVAGCLSTGPLKGMKVEIVGRADPRGTDEYNMKLGESRAQSVADYLQKMGVPKDGTATSSKGKREATGTDENGWANDRRVEIHLVKEGK